MLLTDQDIFLAELTKLFQKGQRTGQSVFITIKRYDGRRTRNPRKPGDKSKDKKTIYKADLEPNEYKCLLKAKLGKKKISFAVATGEMAQFQASYSNVVKSNMFGLQKVNNK